MAAADLTDVRRSRSAASSRRRVVIGGGPSGRPRPPSRRGGDALVLDAGDGDRGRRHLPGPTGRRADAGRDAPRRGRRDRRRDRRRRDPAGLPGQRPDRDPDGTGRRAAARGGRGPARAGRDRRPAAGPIRGRRRRARARRRDARRGRRGVDRRGADGRRRPRSGAAGPAGPDGRSDRPGRGGRRSPPIDHPLPPPPSDPAASSAAAWGSTVARPRRRRGPPATPSWSCSSARRSAGIGTCQGGACLPHVRAWIARPDRRRARALHRPARRPPDHPGRGRRRRLRRRLPADATPRRAPRARRADGPLRRLVAAVALRRRASRSTGRSARGSRSATCRRSASWSSRGPDVVEALERIYPCHVADIKPGRSRYALLLNERGHVMDDGMILRESETRFALTFTRGGAANAEMWIRDWIETWGLRVHVLDRTMSLAAINVTGPLAGELLRRARPGGPAALPRPRPCRGRRRSVPRDAPVVHRRGGLRAAPPGRPVRGAVAGADGPRAPTSASGRTGSRRCSGCGSRRATSSSAWTPSWTRRRAGSGWTGR